MRSAVARK